LEVVLNNGCLCGVQVLLGVRVLMLLKIVFRMMGPGVVMELAVGMVVDLKNESNNPE
jgi:hypothetical protein